MNIRYRVELTQAERSKLTALLNGGKHSARKLKREQILLAADAGTSDEEIPISVGVGGSTVCRTKRRFLVGNLEEALSEEPRPGAFRSRLGVFRQLRDRRCPAIARDGVCKIQRKDQFIAGLSRIACYGRERSTTSPDRKLWFIHGGSGSRG